MESLTIKQLEAMCAAFESVFGEDADFMVWLADKWSAALTQTQNAERPRKRGRGSRNQGGLQ